MIARKNIGTVAITSKKDDIRYLQTDGRLCIACGKGHPCFCT